MQGRGSDWRDMYQHVRKMLSFCTNKSGLGVLSICRARLDMVILPPCFCHRFQLQLYIVVVRLLPPPHVQLCARPASSPFGERSKISNSLRASDLAWLPPTVHGNCSEWLWLHAKTILVALENYSGWLGELSWLARGVELNLPDVRFPLLPTPLPKREYNAISTIADEIW